MLAVCILVGILAAAAWAGERGDPILGTKERAHLDAALDCLNMTEADLGFEKDVAKPLWTLQWVRAQLHEPLRLPGIADRIREASVRLEPDGIWTLMGELLECDATNGAPPTVSAAQPAMPGLEPDLAAALQEFVRQARVAAAGIDRAFGTMSVGQRRYAAASCLAGAFSVEDRPEAGLVLAAAGVSSQDLAQVVAEGNELDPEPAATNFLGALTQVDLTALLGASRTFQQAVSRLAQAAATVSRWPATPVRIDTELGPCIVGTPGAETWTNSALLILDPGGDDVYLDHPGCANGLLGQKLAAIVDLRGNDRYEGRGAFGPASALFGIACVIDREGDDFHRAAYAGQAAVVFGAAWLEDAAGDDTYRASLMAQAAAVVGFAVLIDRSGNDLYDVGMAGQAYSGVRGFGWLVDAGGNDRYLAGGCEVDSERNPGRFVSIAQGFSIGMRPFFGGGVAALVDLAGNDEYVADVYGQGVSYWYSAGFLLDLAGNDNYRVQQYGQGSGIHLSFGLLADLAGNDTYNGGSLVQGNAHDYGVGMLFDKGGDDTYTGEAQAQGRAMNNGLALLIDSAGDDAYFGKHHDECQGIGAGGGPRDYGCLSLLLDLGGRDSYSCGARDDTALQRPLYGIVYDVCSTNRVVK